MIKTEVQYGTVSEWYSEKCVKMPGCTVSGLIDHILRNETYKIKTPNTKFQNSTKHHLKGNEKLTCCLRVPRHPATSSGQHRVAKRAMSVKGVALLIRKWELCKNILKQSSVTRNMYKQVQPHYILNVHGPGECDQSADGGVWHPF